MRRPTRPVSVVTLHEPQERVYVARTRAIEEPTRLEAWRGLLAAHEAAQQPPQPTWWQAAMRRIVRQG